ncbi:MAG: NAD-dependent epimerase/dehydratase family protein [Caulobacteraceae bacterium]|nr:NAD-dependent epimerase/dehydratase family protein [Caulobacteraceae bacterium]
MNDEGPVVVTGAAGFIGRAVAERLLDRGEVVLGVDSFTDYYDPALKEARVATLSGRNGFSLERLDIAETEAFAALVRRSGARRVVHLAAQAGVRYSIDHPFAYEHANLLGHLSVLEACRHAPDFRHLVYASSSSVYGERPLTERGFSEDDPADQPVSLYAATKRSCELMSTAYARLHGLPQSGLRFFTVYGPWGRPDMAYFGFTRKILAGEPIEVFGEGEMTRDFTYIDDIVDGIVGVLDRPPEAGQARLLNIGGAQPRGLATMIDLLEAALGASAVRTLRPMQPGDVSGTFADVSRLADLTGYAPQVALEEGLPRFVAWYRDFYRAKPAAGPGFGGL